MSTLIYPLMSHKNPIMRTDDEAVRQVPLSPSPAFFQIAPFTEDKVQTVPDSLPTTKLGLLVLDPGGMSLSKADACVALSPML